jgi:CheY-like chemotaxis protein
LAIVVVDDDHDTADSTSTLLRFHGHQVFTAGNGADALEYIKSAAPDAVLADLRMPRMDGFELAQQILNHCGDGAPVLIAMTALAEEHMIERIAKAGFHLHLIKPVDPAKLLESLDGIGPKRRDGTSGS